MQRESIENADDGDDRGEAELSRHIVAVADACAVWAPRRGPGRTRAVFAHTRVRFRAHSVPELAAAEETSQRDAREELGEGGRLDARAAPEALAARATRDQKTELRANGTLGGAGVRNVAAQDVQLRAQLLRSPIVWIQNNGRHRNLLVANETHYCPT